MKFAIFVSGNGTNMSAILKACKRGEIASEPAIVFSNRRKAPALRKAEEAGVRTLCLEEKDYTNPQSYERDIVIHLKKEEIDFICFAGFMKMMTPWFTKQFPNRILNVHPSLLPAFKGRQGIKDTYTYGAKVAGVTVHFVDDMMDHGPIILQEAFKVSEGMSLDELTERVHKVEHKLYPKAIALFEQNRLKFSGRKVKVVEK